ncbi:hypothetical protein [Agrobacterium pusense]|uniref:hypothetical protein n=1 Tax=Agrobacterium pusense TaxID=648995 RepID=UPI0032DA39A9
MTSKRTYSVRLDDEQREQLEQRAERLGLATGHLIRTAIKDFLTKEKEKDHLLEFQANIATMINRLGRQVEKDRAEQQLIVGTIDYMREWLAFALPAPLDRSEAQRLQRERNVAFYRDLGKKFSSQSRARLTTRLDEKNAGAALCPACRDGKLQPKDRALGRTWYCTNWNSPFRCQATFDDIDGQPDLASINTTQDDDISQSD